MKTKYLSIALIATFAFGFSACDDNVDPLVEEMELNRVLAPTELTARIRNLTTIELNWNTREDVSHYVVEFSEDELQFTNIIFSDEVTADELPYQRSFEGETRYSARVKAVSTKGVADSKWTAISIMTSPENIFLPFQQDDIEATSVTLRWPANSVATKIILTPGNIEHIVSDEEKIAGIAVVSGLTGETDYTAKLMNGTKTRGTAIFRTLVDIGDAVAVYPEDDLNAVITAAADGESLVLFPGDYTVYTGQIILNKSIAIKGLRQDNKPKLHVQFSLTDGVTNVELRDLDLNGDGTLNDVLRYNTAGVAYGSVSIIGCNVHDFTRSLIAGSVASTVQSFTVDNSIFTDIVTSGGDFIDFRNTHITNVTLTNSTFVRCAPERDFVRIDAAAGYTGTGLTSTVLIDHCTLYGVSNSQDRILYVRFNANVLTVRNTLITATDGYYTNQTSTSQPTCQNNNYFNAPGFYTSPYLTVTNLKIDESGTHTTIDPGFVDVANDNFTLTNQTLIDNEVGDPRWRQ